MIAVKNLIQHALWKLGSMPFTRRFCTYIGSILVVRNLLPSVYAEWAFAYAILAWTLSFFDDGIPKAMHSFRDGEANSYLSYGVILSLLSSLIITLMTIGFSILIPLPMGAGLLRILAGFVIIRGFFQSMHTYFKDEITSTQSNMILSIQSLLLLFLPVLCAFFGGLYGLVLAHYIMYAVGIVMLLYYVGLRNAAKPFSVDIHNMPSVTPFLKETISGSQGRFVADTLFAIDVFWIGMLLGSYEHVAIYAVAALVPVALTAIPQLAMPYISPYLYEFRRDVRRLKRLLVWSISILAIINFVLGFSSFIAIPHTASFIFGSFYAEVGPLFKFLLLAFFIGGSFRIPIIILLASINPEGRRSSNALICAGINFALDIPMIYFFGIYGAALASIIALILGSLIALNELWRYFARIQQEDLDIEITPVR